LKLIPSMVGLNNGALPYSSKGTRRQLAYNLYILDCGVALHL
jgi:hypothetical protein